MVCPQCARVLVTVNMALSPKLWGTRLFASDNLTAACRLNGTVLSLSVLLILPFLSLGSRWAWVLWKGLPLKPPISQSSQTPSDTFFLTSMFTRNIHTVVISLLNLSFFSLVIQINGCLVFCFGFFK